jgi:hypothetical protein
MEMEALKNVNVRNQCQRTYAARCHTFQFLMFSLPRGMVSMRIRGSRELANSFKGARKKIGASNETNLSKSSRRSRGEEIDAHKPTDPNHVCRRAHLDKSKQQYSPRHLKRQKGSDKFAGNRDVD